jgi:hypothetical protein
MLLSLDDERALDPKAAGAKAAWLARARQAGLPVLPGLVITSDHATPYLGLGAEQLVQHGSGRARMTITGTPLPDALWNEVLSRAEVFSAPMVVRSSSALEGSGLWSGAFTSYLDVRHEELPKAVVGCYASVFTQSTVERFVAAGVSPAAAAIAVLVQPALDPESGGTARLVGEDVLVAGVKGSPVPLVQGWDPGVHAKVTLDGAVQGKAAVDTLGEEHLRRVAIALRHAQDAIGANSIEWAFQDDSLWLLQVQRFAVEPAAEGIAVTAELRTEAAAAMGRLIRRFPGPLGEAMVLPWAIADVGLADADVLAPDLDPFEAFREAVAQGAALTAEVWGLPKPVAAEKSRDTLRLLRSPDVGRALSRLAGLRPPDRVRAGNVLNLLAAARGGLVAAGAVAHEESAWHIAEQAAGARLAAPGGSAAVARIGFDRWEPFNATVVAAHGSSVRGTAAAAGVAFGRMCIVTEPGKAGHFRPRDVVVGVHPVPGLAPLLFDAAALITTGGGPAAHLFESARSLGIPALCATRIEDLVGAELSEVTDEWALAVDGTTAVVHGVPW